MPGVPEHAPRRSGLNGDEEPEVSWVTVEEAPAEVPEDLQMVADAAESGNVEALEEAMRSLTVSINSRADDGDTALHLAALHGHAQCVEVLLSKGASVLARDEDGAVPLHDAAASGFTDCVTLLLNAAEQQGCIEELLKASDIDGDTPLHHAARGNHVAVVEQLLGAGADASIENGVGKKPYRLADDLRAVDICQRPLLPSD
ncbi:hypothetical protein KFL_002260160 [Klebsormidium nitens]|uniref:Uncharacterized protein n=1 Tax=Klebsormidium nitens TaxID=105231 RepID=A0A1Y1I2V4_KLENI|nr:hypothetical protein KFL_002260160 [Klebsormidium nitens]|eukprot:GAQ85260.1 hypothetical protein KFL_002260160 [Klebsormidium nitens]